MSKSNLLSGVHGILILFKHFIFVLINYCLNLILSYPTSGVLSQLFQVTYKMGLLALLWELSESLGSSPDRLKSVSEYFYDFSAKISLHASLHWIKRTNSIESLELLLTENRAKYHKTCFPSAT